MYDVYIMRIHVISILNFMLFTFQQRLLKNPDENFKKLIKNHLFF